MHDLLTRVPTPENAKSAYDISLKLADKMARIIWSVFAALVGTNAFFVTLATLMIQHTQAHAFFVCSLAILGILICVAWFLMTSRTYDYYRYFFACARKLEQYAFDESIQTIRQGEVFSRGGIVKFEDKEEIQLRWVSRLFKVEWLINLIIFKFGALYGYLFVATLKG